MESKLTNNDHCQSTPILRFPSFSDDWKKYSLNKVAKVIDCKHRTPPYVDDGIPVISPGTIQWGKLDLLTPKKRVTYEEFESLMDHCNPENGNLVFSRNQSIGIASIVTDDNNFVLGQDTVLIQSFNIDSLFLYYRIQTRAVQNTIRKLSGGSTFSRINLKDIRNLKLNKIPFSPEQTKIANFLTAVDKRISLLQKKKKQLEQYKKGVMQKIFSQEIRFKDENGKKFPDWKEKSLGTLGKTYNGLTGKTKVDFGDGKPYIQYLQIFNNSRIETSKFGFVKIEANEKQNSAQYGDIFFTTSSETPKEIGFSSVLTDPVDEVYLNSFCFGYRPNSLDELVPEFSQFLFRSFNVRKEIIKLAQGSTRFNMSKVELMKLRVLIPNKQEQQKIANFLSAIDKQIENIEKQIQASQNWKKGLLQKMFV